MKFPKKKWTAGTPEKVTVSEDQLQQQCNDFLDALQIEYIRIPDGIWRWLQMNAPAHIQAFFRKTFRGQADNICMIPVSDKYSLCLNLELKTKIGKLHGEQKTQSKALAWQVSRSPEDTIKIVMAFKRDAETFRRLFDRVQKIAEEN